MTLNDSVLSFIKFSLKSNNLSKSSISSESELNSKKVLIDTSFVERLDSLLKQKTVLFDFFKLLQIIFLLRVYAMFQYLLGLILASIGLVSLVFTNHSSYGYVSLIIVGIGLVFGLSGFLFKKTSDYYNSGSYKSSMVSELALFLEFEDYRMQDKKKTELTELVLTKVLALLNIGDNRSELPEHK